MLEQKRFMIILLNIEKKTKNKKSGVQEIYKVNKLIIRLAKYF